MANTPIIVDVPGYGPTEFQNEAQVAEFYKKNVKGETKTTEQQVDEMIANDPNAPGFVKFLANPQQHGFLGKLLDKLNTTAENFRDSFTANMTKKAGNLGEYLSEKMTGGERGYVDIAEARKQAKHEQDNRNPVEALGGAIAGLFAPGGAFGNTAALGTKTIEGIGMKSVPWLQKVLGAGLGNTLFGQLAEDENASGKERAVDAGIDFGLAAAIPTVLQGGKVAVKGIADAGLKYKVPQRMYASATGMGKEFAENPQMVETLLKDNVVGSKMAIKGMADKELKNVGDQLRSMLTGKEANYDDIVKRIGDFESQFASGERAGADRALKKVLDEFKGLFKEQASPSMNGVMQRPSYDEFKSSIINKFGGSPKAKAYVTDASKASEEDVLDYYLGKIQSAQNAPNVIIRRSAGGSNLKTSPYYSETIKEGRATPFGRDLPESFFPKAPRPRNYTPANSQNVVDDFVPQPTEEDILRLYAQQYPDEFIKLAASPGKVSRTMDLADLNFEKSRLANAASKLYRNPDMKAQSLSKAQKQVADATRAEIEHIAPEVMELNQRYHTYDALNNSIENALEREYARPIGRLSLSDMGVGGSAAAAGGGPAGLGAIAAKKGIETTGAQTRMASFLYNLLNKGPKTGFQSMPATTAGIMELLNQLAGPMQE